jgi:hypothetical protein
VSNRFVRRIKSGDIDSVGELKSEFKELAKLTHPDLKPVQGGEDEFVAIRAEYEAALRDFEKHRFGASRGDRRRRAADGGATGSGSGEDGTPLSDAAWFCLELMLKRGFPKLSRHEKQRLRYEYARWRFTECLGEERGGLFTSFESELLDLRAFGSGLLEATLALLRDLIEYRYTGITALRTNVVLSYGRLKNDPGAGQALRGFLDLLASDLGIGGELPV